MSAAGLPTRSALDALMRPEAFVWATGIEDTFITDPWHATGRTLDEYELTGHYERQADDLDLVVELGVQPVRYGFPWHRLEPEPGRFDFAFADAAVDRLLERGVAPIVDLVHYGTPRWLEAGFAHPDYPARVAAFAAAVAERFRGRVHWYTPMNEPRIGAWYAGRLGWWPPYRRGWRGFAELLVAMCRGIVATDAALRAIDDEVVLCHVDSTDLYETSDPALAGEVALRQALVFLALDLVTGRVGADHALRGWLAGLGMNADVIDPFAERPLHLDVVGINLYPMFTWKWLAREGSRLRIRMRYASAELLERLAAMYARRYGRPLLVTETASAGSVRRRRAWLDDSLAAVRRLRGRGIPLVGYTWWPLFSLVGWSYRQGHRPLEKSLVHMGLFDLDPRPALRLARLRTPLVGAFRDAVAAGTAQVGPLAAVADAVVPPRAAP